MRTLRKNNMREIGVKCSKVFILSVTNIRALINLKILCINYECCNFRVNTKIIETEYITPN